MNIKTYFKISVGVAVLLATQISCIHDDNWDAPEITCNNKFDAPTITMAEFAAKTSGTIITIPAEDATHPAVIFDAYVVSSDEGGNFYKTISFQDKPENPTVGLQVGLNKSMNYADFPVGAHIRIKANGMMLGKDPVSNVLQIGLADPNYAIGRIPQSIIGRYIAGVCNGTGLDIVKITPREVTLGDIKNEKYINTLVTVKNAQFATSVNNVTQIGLGLMNKDASNTFIDTNRTIEDQYGGTAIIRTDGFFKGSSYKIPDAHGDITFVVSRYGTSSTSWQNIIRDVNDLKLTTPGRLSPATNIFNEGFSNFTTNGWTAFNVAGSKVWEIGTGGSVAPYALMNGGLGAANEDWLISKSIPLTGYTSAKFYFETDVRFAGPVLEAYVTTDNYTGGNPTGLNWVKLDANLDTDVAAYGGFVGSGLLDLTPYLGKNVRFAFKYTSTATAASAWEVDNVKVFVTP